MGIKLPIAKEGWPFIVVPGAFALGLARLGRRRLALPFAAAAMASVGFYRDPERAIPSVVGGLLSPADGRVLSIEDAVDPFVGPSVRVAIFLSPLDVHINRSPVEGVVTRIVYHPGRFLPAYDARAAENEFNEIWVDADGITVVFRQVVGILARRLVCRIAEGQGVRLGERIGLMKFGSRMDVFLPPDTPLQVAVGQSVVAGETVLATLRRVDAA